MCMYVCVCVCMCVCVCDTVCHAAATAYVCQRLCLSFCVYIRREMRAHTRTHDTTPPKRRPSPFASHRPADSCQSCLASPAGMQTSHQMQQFTSLTIDQLGRSPSEQSTHLGQTIVAQRSRCFAVISLLHRNGRSRKERPRARATSDVAPFNTCPSGRVWCRLCTARDAGGGRNDKGRDRWAGRRLHGALWRCWCICCQQSSAPDERFHPRQARTAPAANRAAWLPAGSVTGY